MSYRLSIPRSVNKRMEKLPTDIYDRVDGAILALADEPRPPGCKKLRGQEDWRIRVGDYRVIYGVDDERRVVEILNVAHRGDVYR
ncbi:MAG: type II toxin-antitoxin system RelE/ParE family toxin [Rubrobacter sp.]|nr:type II toxin-antitoxin system RelE/ParE family toxin [Rubrobacter sp.]